MNRAPNITRILKDTAHVPCSLGKVVT